MVHIVKQYSLKQIMTTNELAEELEYNQAYVLRLAKQHLTENIEYRSAETSRRKTAPRRTARRRSAACVCPPFPPLFAPAAFCGPAARSQATAPRCR